jgi:hypothetical protein
VKQVYRVRCPVRARRDTNSRATSYLKTASIFGFTGIYKRLAIALGIVTDELRLDTAGEELVAAWAKDHGLPGFRDGREGEGASFREKLRRAVEQGMQLGRTSKLTGPLYEQIALLTEPVGAGRQESKLLMSLLHQSKREPEMTAEIVNVIDKHQALVLRGDEAEFLRQATRGASEGLKIRLNAINAFEALCKPILDAFDGIRILSTNNHRAPIGLPEFRDLCDAKSLVTQVKEGIARVRADRFLLEWEPGVRELVDGFDQAKDAESLFRSVLDRHDKTQAEKPPHGKRPWIERLPSDQVSVRAAYARNDDREEFDYVYEYRTPSLSMFLQDLGRFS